VIGSLVSLEEIEFQIHLSFKAGFKLSSQWMELEHILRTSHQNQCLRKLVVHVDNCNMGPDSWYHPSAKAEAEDAKRKWEELWEGYMWCKANLEFITSVSISRCTLPPSNA
jgi:hypothetical protein